MLHKKRIGEKGSSPANASSLASLLSQEGETMKRRWTKEEEQFLRDNADKGGRYIADELNRPVTGVQSKACNLGIKLGNRLAWGPEEISLLKKLYPMLGVECYKAIGRSKKSVSIQASRLNIKSSLGSGRIKEHNLYAEQIKHKNIIALESYRGTRTAIKHKHLDCGLEWTTRPDYILNANSSCPKCYHSYSDHLYIVFFEELDLYKIGITNNVSKRLKRYNKIPTLIYSVNLNNYDTARATERYLLSKVVLLNTGLLNAGNTETFKATKEEVIELKKFVEFA